MDKLRTILIIIATIVIGLAMVKIIFHIAVISALLVAMVLFGILGWFLATIYNASRRRK